MTKVCVEIEMDDQTGEVSVGVCPPSEEATQADQQADKSYMQPAKSLEDALNTAKDLLSNAGQAQQASQGETAMDQIRRGYQGPAKMAMQGGGGMQGGM